MSVKRPLGLENEYGITQPGNPYANAMALSAHVVSAYGEAAPASVARWDYTGEDPLNDARGYRLERASAAPSQLTDDPEQLAPSGTEATLVERPGYEQLNLPAPTNYVLANGGRLYVDHAHPEYATPEVTTPREAIAWDRAGTVIMRRAMAHLARGARGGQESGQERGEVVVYKNNTDGKGASYGTHENYLVLRRVPFDELIRYITPFLVTRQIMCGAGRVGLGQKSQDPGFQISQRADFVENEVGLETTFNRPIINTRDEPHADPARWRRLHVIGGDANTFDASNLLKLGSLSLVLWVLEHHGAPLGWDSLDLGDPVIETWNVSRDTELKHRLVHTSGEESTAVEIQRVYLEYVVEKLTENTKYEDLDGDTREVVELWREVLDGLETDPFTVASKVEWVAKYQMLSALRQRRDVEWDSPTLAAFDLQWHDLREESSIAQRLENAGRATRLITDSEVAYAVENPPSSTRAWLRGNLISRFGNNVASAGWSSITLDDPGREKQVRLAMRDPLRGSRELAQRVFDGEADIAGVIERLTSGG